MIMSPGLRKFALTVHVITSVGWIGAVIAYLALGIAAVTSPDVQTVRAVWIGMKVTGWFAIVPLAIAALLTGLVISLGTKWGLFRHWWVLISFVLTIFATVVLLLETRTIGALAAVAADPATSGDALRSMGGTLLHSIGGAIVLVVILVLNVYKPRGVTPYGWRRQQEERRAIEGR